MKKDTNELEDVIGYTFRDHDLLVTALTHSSYSNEMKRGGCRDYERMEFLGDAVLELISSDYLYQEHPDMPEGDLTKLRASMVCEPALAHCARLIGLEEYIRLGRGEEATGGRQKDSIISDVLEAIIGGIYLDSGIEDATSFVHRFIMNHESESVSYYDAKSKLQQIVQARGQTVVYDLIDESGPDHAKVFTVSCVVGGTEVSRGQGPTKRKAQQAAAGEALRSGKCI